MNIKIVPSRFGVFTTSSVSLQTLINENARYKRKYNSKNLL